MILTIQQEGATDLQRQIFACRRVEYAHVHRAGIGKLNRSFRGKLESSDVGNRGIENEVRASAARVHGKLAEVLERDVRSEINRTVNSRQHQQVKPGKCQDAARRSGSNSIHTDQGKFCYAAVAQVNGRIPVERQALEFKG